MTPALLVPLLLSIPPFQNEAEYRYINPTTPAPMAAAIRGASCQFCHAPGRDRTQRNEFGDALSQYLDKDRFPQARLKADPKGVAREIEAALEVAEAEKASDGKTFLQRLAEGRLPSP
jgi:hypothetical protein